MSVKPIPEGHEGLIAHLVVDGAKEAIEFYSKAFGAKLILSHPMPDGSKLMHAELKIGSSVVYLADDFPEFGGSPRNPKALGGSPVNLHFYVKDVDAAIKRAGDAGAEISMEPADMFWGDRYGKVTDPFGHEWSFATHIADPTEEEMKEAAEAMFSGAPKG